MINPQDSQFEPAVATMLANRVVGTVGEDGICQFNFTELRDAVVEALEEAMLKGEAAESSRAQHRPSYPGF